MYRPSLRPGEEFVKTSPGVTVKNVAFDAFLTSKRIIFVKKTDDFQERKELVFPLNLVKDFIPSSDESGTPDIRFSIEKPSGEVGDLVLRFVQTGDYRYAERDDWIENLKNLSRGIVPRNTGAGGANAFSGDIFSTGTSPGARPSPNADIYGGRPDESYAPPFRDFQQIPVEDQYSSHQGFSQPPQASQAPPPPSFPGGQPSAAPVPDDAVSTMFCRFCGAKVPSSSVFCPSCGGKLGGQHETGQPSFSRAPPQRPPVKHQQAPPPPPPVQSGGGGFVAPPSPPVQGGYGQPSGYPPRDGGISLADDRGYGYDSGRQLSPKSQKAMMKGQAKADKARMKEQSRAEKERRKAMKRAQKGGGGGYDSYGYSESRMPEPKIIMIIIAVIAVIAVAGYAFTSGMIGGGSGDTSPGDSQSPVTTANPTYEPGTTTTSTSYGSWYFEVLYAGDWSGTYTYNGQSYPISGFGYHKSPNMVDPSGTITISISKNDGGNGVDLQVDLYNPKGIEVASDHSTNMDAVVTVNYTVS